MAKTIRYKVYNNTVNGHTEEIKDGYDWKIFFCGPLWYLNNAMVSRGIMLILIAVLAAACTHIIGGVVVWIIAGIKANKERKQKFLKKNWVFVGYRNLEE